MPHKWKYGLLICILAVDIATTPYFGSVVTTQFSAYSACRKVAMETKGYDIWEHEQTISRLFVSWTVFNDGYNDLSCQAIGIGPFWVSITTFQTLVGCLTSLKDGGEMCPEDYFGISP